MNVFSSLFFSYREIIYSTYSEFPFEMSTEIKLFIRFQYFVKFFKIKMCFENLELNVSDIDLFFPNMCHHLFQK